MDLFEFLTKISIYAIPILFAITLHEVAHGRTARYFGDHTAEMLGRLSLNPMRHIDPIGTLLVPGLLLAVGGPMFGWAKPVPVATSVLRNPRLATVLVALAGPAANLFMAAAWCVVLAAIMRVNGNETLNGWIASMAHAGIFINVGLAAFNLIPIPPLDGGRILVGLLPPPLAALVEKVEPVGVLIVIGLSVLGLLGWLFGPTYHLTGWIIKILVGLPS